MRRFAIGLAVLLLLCGALVSTPRTAAQQPPPANPRSDRFLRARESVFALHARFRYPAPQYDIDQRVREFSRVDTGFVFEEGGKQFFIGPAHVCAPEFLLVEKYEKNIEAIFSDGQRVALELRSHDVRENVAFFAPRRDVAVQPLHLFPPHTELVPGIDLVSVATYGPQWYAAYGPLHGVDIRGSENWPLLLTHGHQLMSSAFGSPVISLADGAVVGMNNRMLRDNGMRAPFATPAATIRRLLPQ